MFDWIKHNNNSNSATATSSTIHTQAQPAASTANNNNILINQIPSMKEKLILLQRLTLCIEKRFLDNNSDIQKQFLEIIAYVYHNEIYSSNIEFKVKLEQAFLLGLRTSNAELRQDFFNLFNKNFNCNDLYERLCYIVVTQNWELFSSHYWIKQCIQLTIGSCIDANSKILLSGRNSSNSKFLFPNILNTMNDLSRHNENSPARTVHLDTNNKQPHAAIKEDEEDEGRIGSPSFSTNLVLLKGKLLYS